MSNALAETAELATLLDSMIDDGAVAVTITEEWPQQTPAIINIYGTPLKKSEELRLKYDRIRHFILDDTEWYCIIEVNEFAPGAMFEEFLYSENEWVGAENSTPVNPSKGLENLRNRISN